MQQLSTTMVPVGNLVPIAILHMMDPQVRLLAFLSNPKNSPHNGQEIRQKLGCTVFEVVLFSNGILW